MSPILAFCSPLFEDLAVNEIRRAFPRLEGIQNAAPGILLCEPGASFGRFSKYWQCHPPIYLHYITPLHLNVPVASDLNEAVIHLARQIEPLMETARKPCLQVWSDVSCVPHNASLQRLIAEALSTRLFPLHQADQIVSVLHLSDPHGQRLMAGLAHRHQTLSRWIGGRMPAPDWVPNRAGYKLLEAFQTFGFLPKPGTRVLDLGAAPGAWTEVLRQQGAYVTAVSPGLLYQHLYEDPSVTHFEMEAEAFLSTPQERYELITNDMKLDGQDSARIMIALAGTLPPDGPAIMTLKIRPHSRRRVMDHSYRLLRKAYRIVRVRQLYYNRNEVTLFLRRKRKFS